MKTTGISTYKTTCSYCGVGCGIIVEKDSKGRLNVTGDKDNPVNRGMLCSKGMNLHHVVQDKSDRLLYPEMRLGKNLPSKRVSWDDAMKRITSVIKSVTKKYGPDSFGFYVSGQCLTEEYYIANKIAKGFIQTNNIDTNSRLCMSSAVVGYKMALGEDAVPVSYDDIELADCFFITGANPAWCHPILFRRIEAHRQSNPDVKLIVVDPRKTQTCTMADLHLQLKPGTDTILNNAIAKCLIDEGYTDMAFIEKYTEGYDKLSKQLSAISLENATEICDVPLDQIKLAAHYIGRSKGFISMWAMGLNQSVVGVEKNLSLLNLSLITGKIGKPGSGPLSLTGQPNAMGGREVGGMANLLPAHRNLNNPGHRNEVAKFWGVDSVPEKPGYTATEMFDAILEDKLKVIWIICTNPLVSLPNARLVEEALKKARFVIVQDISGNSVTAHYADITLPAAGWLEKEGTMTNSDRRISYLPKVVDAPGEAWSDVKILLEFAKRMGFDGFRHKTESDVFEEHKALTEGTNIDITGLSYDWLQKNGSAQWPFKKMMTRGQERLFEDGKFYTPSGKAQLFAFEGQNQSEPTSDEFPLVLTTGRIRDQWHTMTRTGKVNRLNQHISKPFLEIHPDDAATRGIKDNDLVEITSKNGDVRLRATITVDIKKGVVFLPMHWGKILQSDKARANNLTTTLVDPTSKEPDFKFTSVDVKTFEKKPEHICIIGAGAAACRFVEKYRELNSTDHITIFSKEKHPFYNRVLLPEYITGEKVWDNLVKLHEGRISELNLDVLVEKEIVNIDAKNKCIIDQNGKEYFYDKLILATGSRPNIPRGIKLDYKGLFAIRNREDADRLNEYMTDKKSVLIVGGGLLGLEIASSMLEMNVAISLVHRNARLMDKQLDKTSSELLGEIVEEKGINIHLNDEIETLTIQADKPGAYKIAFRSGRIIYVDAVIYAIGTVPNIELGKIAKLDTGRGIVVNSHMTTSDPNIFAMGEIAEYNGSLYGITVAAEQQAEIAATYISGDHTVKYDGSVLMNILKFPGIQLSSIGMAQTPKDSAYEEILFIDRSSRYYKKCIIHNDRLVGTILMGDKNEFLEFRDLIEKRMELSQKRLTLLRSGKAPEAAKGKLVCSCNNVGKGNIEDEIKSGNNDFNKICQNTGAGMGCGSCKPEVKEIMEAFKVKVESQEQRA